MVLLILEIQYLTIMPYWKSNIEPLVAILLFLLTLIFAVGNMIINRDGKFICLIYSCCFLSRAFL